MSKDAPGALPEEMRHLVASHAHHVEVEYNHRETDVEGDHGDTGAVVHTCVWRGRCVEED